MKREREVNRAIFLEEVHKNCYKDLLLPALPKSARAQSLNEADLEAQVSQSELFCKFCARKVSDLIETSKPPKYLGPIRWLGVTDDAGNYLRVYSPFCGFPFSDTKTQARVPPSPLLEQLSGPDMPCVRVSRLFEASMSKTKSILFSNVRLKRVGYIHQESMGLGGLFVLLMDMALVLHVRTQKEAMVSTALYELFLMQGAGLTPFQALHSTLINATKLLNAHNKMGQIAPGFVAGFIEVDCDPFQDVDSLRDISLVIQSGRVVREDS